MAKWVFFFHILESAQLATENFMMETYLYIHLYFWSNSSKMDFLSTYFYQEDAFGFFIQFYALFSWALKYFRELEKNPDDELSFLTSHY